MKRNIIILLSLAICAASCVKDELRNPECDITSAYAGVADAEKCFFQLSDTAASINADYAASVIQFQRVTPWADLSSAAPRFVLSDGAILYPESGTPRNFSNDTTHVYYCIAEDEIVLFRQICASGKPIEEQLAKASEAGRHIRMYYVQYKHSATDFAKVVEYNFEHFYLEPKKNKYYEWSDPDASGSMPAVSNWATANVAYSIARSSAKPDEYPTTPVRGEGVDGGNAVKLTTCSTGEFGQLFGMPLAAGNLFLGTFDMSQALTNTMKATRFGDNITLDRAPMHITGYYKYFPGRQMISADGSAIDATDQPAIYCIVYRNHDENGNPVVVYGDNINDSRQIVARAEIKEFENNTNHWVPFDIEFTWYEQLDIELLMSKGYSYSIVCSSSKDGASYSGALGSALYVDNIKMYYY